MFSPIPSRSKKQLINAEKNKHFQKQEKCNVEKRTDFFGSRIEEKGKETSPSCTLGYQIYTQSTNLFPIKSGRADI